MTAREVIETCYRHMVILTREGDQVVATALFPDDFPMTDDLVEQVRRLKPAILVELAFRERADDALLASTARIGAAWSPGCDLDTPEWVRHEHHLHEAYWSGDLNTLEAVLASREDYAMQVFDQHRNEVNHV